MTELFDYLTGMTVIKAYTDNTAAAADALSAAVKFRSLAAEDGGISVTVGIFDEKYVLGLLSSLGISCEVTKRTGLLFFLKKYIRRVGLFLGGISAAVIIFFLSNTVLRIEISGNDTVTEAEIMSMLRDSGVDYGMFIPSLNLRKAEKVLLSMSDKFTDASIRSSGFRIIVSVSEGLTDIFTENKNQPSNIISLYDATITGVNVQSGMLMPIVGDTVRRGEILISGIVSKKFGGSFTVRSAGEITGQYKRTAEFSEEYINTYKIYGEEYKRKYIRIFGKNFALPHGNEPDGRAEYIKSSEYVNFMGLTLPIEVTVLDVFPYTYEKVTASKEELIENANERLRDFENNLLKNSGEKIIDRKIKYISSEKGITLKAEYLLEGNIGIEKPFFPLKISDREREESADIKK